MIPVVDVFAGPGGLNEGFSHVRSPDGNPVFEVVASFERDESAIATLKLRAALRLLDGGAGHDGYQKMLAGRMAYESFLRMPDVAQAINRAEFHVRKVELGPQSREVVRAEIASRLRHHDDWVLIGGPPCQAYSLVGRSRRRHDESFAADEKHFLYREYLDIIEYGSPAVFVMENVKGLLSASHGGRSMFPRIIEDLQLGGRYDVRSLVTSDPNPAPRDFVIRAEEYGVPQRRHRVILVGVRKDLAERALPPLERRQQVTVRDAIHGMRGVQSEVNRGDEGDWSRAFLLGVELGKRARRAGADGPVPPVLGDASRRDRLHSWYGSSTVPLSLHQPRRHMAKDMARYAYLATMAEWGMFPRVDEFPRELVPEHKNLALATPPFLDRFKVQTWDRPSSTVASHISKDGHYYIHPDPMQMRSLTVREAARLQTFPDDYYFCGPRTMQYHQVGNAVPPLLAMPIGVKVAELLEAL